MAKARASVCGVSLGGSEAGGGELEVRRRRKAQSHSPKMGRDEMFCNWALFHNGPNGKIQGVLGDAVMLSQSMICKKRNMGSKYLARVLGRNA